MVCSSIQNKTVIFAKIKAWGFTLLGFVATVLGFFVIKQNRDKWKDRAERAEAKSHRIVVAAKKENELTQETRSRRADAVNEIEEKGFSTDLANPNDRWVRKRTD